MTMAVAWCEQAPDGVVVYRRSGDHLLDQGKLKPSPLQGEIAFVNLEQLSDGWSVAQGTSTYGKASRTRLPRSSLTSSRPSALSASNTITRTHSNLNAFSSKDLTVPPRAVSTSSFLRAEFVATAKEDCSWERSNLGGCRLDLGG